MNRLILTINAGSSSIKFAIFSANGHDEGRAVAEGKAVNIGSAGTNLAVHDGGGACLLSRDYAGDADEGAVLQDLLAWVESHFGGTLAAAGHRVVHGGPRFHAPCRITSGLVEELATLVPLAPLHQPHNLAPVRVLARDFPGLPQFACFDTGFHADNSLLATTFGIPRELTGQGVRRYGFHGISYEYIASCLPDYLGDAAEERVVIAHLGNGASLCAMHRGRSVATTMGFTALDGLMMGTRCGSIDPGVLLYLMQEKSMSAQDVSEMLYHRSGLLGVSGISNDMQALLASPALEAREAVDLFVYRIVRELGSLAAALGGLDALVFTGGIGEHAAPVRAAVCRQMAWLGLALDEAANAAHGPKITAEGSAVPALVIPTDEDRMIARHCLTLLGKAA
ncbi:acetate/propionate family kinase [Novosphingobium beihaiensis]|uniref:Acetate kinase n=1 Tax=Novosphingobium beihaiensis TaxID=2930389 RepID=A0ABT0BL05_9SPHN|nr:acetate/propionate family kinase [Novosphingobium beihaiensis]MCJ2185722.1 acetate/propionate family kinase [Novosphingobium beihaiensis]